MFSFLKLCAIVMVVAFPLFIWIGIEQGNTPPEKIISHPKTANEYLNRGKLYEKNGNYEKALQDYTQVVALRPNDEDGYIRQGLALEGLNRPQDALQKYQKAKEIAQGDRNEIQTIDLLIQKLNQRK
ncbi:TPR repeat-containing protein (plasmid) [Leptolyngbya sp. NIES-3755]|nr:TPR repeat-containing protein [Leptolyngbya sp. NIES-3755]